MPARLLPQADAGNLEALEGASFKLSTLQPGENRILAAATEVKLQQLLPRFREELDGRQAVSGQQSEATKAAELGKAELRLTVTHFIKTLNMAIERGKDGFRPGDRTYFGLDASQETLPKMEREPALLRVARGVVSGEAKRVAAGGKPIPMPSATEIQTLLNQVTSLLAAQQKMISVNDQEAQDLGTLRDDVAELVKDIWDELEFAYRKESAPTMRRRCREWGVVYSKDAGETEEEAVTEQAAANTPSRQVSAAAPTPAVAGPADEVLSA